MKMRFPVLILTITMVAACDGGTSFPGTTSGPPPAGGEGLAITGTNATAAMSVALYAAFESGEVGDVVGTLGVDTANVGKMNKVASGQLGSGTLFNATQNVPFGPFDQPCLISGMMRISGDLADPLGMSFSSGDTLTVIAMDCVDVPGETVNGQIDYDFVLIAGDILVGPPFEMTIDVTLTDFQVDDSTDTNTANGNATVTLDTLADPDWLVSIDGPILTSDTSTSSNTLSNFSQTQTVNTAAVPTPYTMISSGTVDSTDLDDIVDYSTPVMFEGLDQAYPYTGEFLVSGDNSSVRLIALDEVNVRLESDFNGDGVVDETTDTTWDALIAQANP